MIVPKLMLAFVLAQQASSGSAQSAACDACDKAAAAGDIPAAARAAASCNDEARKRACALKVKRSAPGLAKAAAFNGQCDKARSIARAAEGMGAASNALRAALKTCK